MSRQSRIALLLGAMGDVFISHINTLSGISEMLENTPEEAKRDLSWTLGWNMARMQDSLLSATTALCREMERSGLESPALDLEINQPDSGPEEFILFWIEHLISQAAILRLTYDKIQEEILRDPEVLEEGDDFWDEGLKDLLRKNRE